MNGNVKVMSESANLQTDSILIKVLILAGSLWPSG